MFIDELKLLPDFPLFSRNSSILKLISLSKLNEIIALRKLNKIFMLCSLNIHWVGSLFVADNDCKVKFTVNRVES